MIKKFEAFYKKYAQTETEVEQYELMKDFTLSLSLDELLVWNNFIDEKLQKSIQITLKKGLTEDDNVWFKQQFAKFDALETILKPNIAQRKAA
jgi:hypothetical protein